MNDDPIQDIADLLTGLPGDERIWREALEIDDLDLEFNVEMLLSESVLGRDWNTPEEDEAWADL